MTTQEKLTAIEQNELATIEGGTSTSNAAVQKFLDVLDHALSTLKNPDTWKGMQVYYPQ